LPEVHYGRSSLAATGDGRLSCCYGELLSHVSTLDYFQSQAARLRRQISIVNGELRLRHTGTSRSMPWSETAAQFQFLVDEHECPGPEFVDNAGLSLDPPTGLSGPSWIRISGLVGGCSWVISRPACRVPPWFLVAVAGVVVRSPRDAQT